MSFGFSVGDFLAAASLIEQAVSALREAGGSAFQYQRIILELHSLKRSIQEVDCLEAEEGLEATVEAIKATALSCLLPLREFLESIQQYDKTLRLGQTAGIMKDVFHKVKWVACHKSEAALKLYAEITAYLGGINLLLAIYQVKLKALGEQRARRRFESLNTTLTSMHIQNRTIIEDMSTVREDLKIGTTLVRMDIEQSTRQTSQALQKLQENCAVTFSGFLRKAGALSEVTLETFAKVTQIYNVVLLIQSRLSQPDTRHTFFQEPMKFEDAYGRILPIPVEYDYLMIEGIVRSKFHSGRGKSLVERDQWQLFNPGDAQNIFSPDNWESVPGMDITMAMIIPQLNDEMVCPRLNCASKTYNDALGGGKICSGCGAWFDNIQIASTPRLIEVEGTNEENTDLSSGSYAGASNARLLAGFESEKGEEKSGQRDPEPESDFEIDSNDLRFLKHARLRPLRNSAAPVDQVVGLDDEDRKKLFGRKSCDRKAICKDRPFCDEHNKCNIARCAKEKCQFGGEFEDFCFDHFSQICFVESCSRKRSAQSRYCNLHSCQFVDRGHCPKEARPGRGKPFCTDHKCSDFDCPSLRSFSEIEGLLIMNAFCPTHECEQNDCVKHNVPDKPFCNLHCCTNQDCTRARDNDPRFDTLCYDHYEERVRNRAVSERIAERLAEIRLREEQVTRVQASNKALDEARRLLEERRGREAAADEIRRQHAAADEARRLLEERRGREAAAYEIRRQHAAADAAKSQDPRRARLPPRGYEPFDTEDGW